MKKEIAKIWLKALRSDKYKQGVGQLATEEGEFCCLGVLCDIAVKKGVVERYDYHGEEDSVADGWSYGLRSEDLNGLDLPSSVQKWAGIKTSTGVLTLENKVTSLSQKNDGGASFSEIADIIEQHIEEL